MSFGIISLALLLAPALVSAAPAGNLVSIQKFDGETTGRYIVTLKDGADKGKAFDSVSAFTASGSSNITHEWDSSFFNGFAGEFDQDSLNALRESADVASIEEDGIYTIQSTVTQTTAPWGLSRLSQDGRVSGSVSARTFRYSYDDSAGKGVDIYILDTGIRTTHSDFGGRAKWGATYGGYANADGHGHGTHVAGTSASASFGVAKAANLIAVKVLSDAGSGTTADIVSGLNYVATSAASTGRPSIASLSLGGSASTALDNGVTSLITRGVHVTVAAGNSNTDAGSTSPARATAVTTVGASDINDARASFSNYGSVVDIFAPGVNIISTWSTSDSATASVSGTSQATPHVAGLTAYFIGRYGNGTPAAILGLIKQYALTGVLTGIPSGTVNLSVRNDI